MWALTRPGPAALDALRARAAALPLSYPEEGMTRGDAPPGYFREDHAIELAVDFARAREALLTFATHRLGYLFAHPPDARVALGADVIVCARLGPLWSINPCRIVYLDDTADRCCYAYGTLPGHTERGEESFTVLRLPDGRVRASTIAYARMAARLARLGAPVARRVQRRVKIDYLRALADAAAG